MKRFTILLLVLLISQIGFTQSEKRPLSLEDVQDWKRITETKISNDGNHIAYVLKPWKGDTELIITTKSGIEKKRIKGAYAPQFTKGSDFLIFKIAPLEERIRALKLKKTKKDKMPLDQLAIYNLKSDKMETIDRLKTYTMAEELDGWIAYQVKTAKKEKELEEKPKFIEKNEVIVKEKKAKEESNENGYTLVVKNVRTGKKITKPFVTQFFFAEEGNFLVFLTKGKEKDILPGIYRFNLKNNQQNKVISAKGTFKKISIKKDASMIAFLHDTTQKEDDAKDFKLYLWNGTEEAKVIVDNKSEGLKDGWVLSPNKNIRFAEKTNRIFFGTAPKAAEEDSSILKEEIPVVDVWHYKEPVLQTVQIVNKSRDLKKAYLSVYFMDAHKVVSIDDQKFNAFHVADEGNADYAIATSDLAYGVMSMWQPYPHHNDFYLVDVNSGKAKKLKTDCRATPRTSPEGKYIYWYNAMDTTWNTYNPKTAKEYKISNPDLIQVADEMNDIPNPPSSYGIVGWAKEDKALYVYDRYDIWKLDPENKEKPKRITTNGKEHNIEYRLISFNNAKDWNKEGMDIGKSIYLFGHNNVTREDGYYKASLKKAKNPTKLIEGAFMLQNRPIKAKDENVVIFTKENFETYPNLLMSDLSFENTTQISDANPQQNEFIWGTAELYSWASLDGTILNGTLHKPENFDPNKKYPLIVNFYEKNSQRLYSYRMPENHRSTVDYHYYTSNGYIVFNPDVFYKTGYPGEDAYNCVMPGITNLIDEGYIDIKAIGAQGHSWGGYQVAYMATRTNMFAAIESGAPVVNMFSAYGGIRWNTGLNRSFQYEHTQSRIGKTIWESPLRYIENSPIFTMDKVNTPILIMANDDDGYVPWWQGIEYFIALRRMGKPAWLLNYNNADHWPLKQHDKFDFQKRLVQFFDHYLKGKPMPKWMKEGIPAVKKGQELGYELME